MKKELGCLMTKSMWCSQSWGTFRNVIKLGWFSKCDDFVVMFQKCGALHFVTFFVLRCWTLTFFVLVMVKNWHAKDKGANARQNGIFCEKMWHYKNVGCNSKLCVKQRGWGGRVLREGLRKIGKLIARFGLAWQSNGEAFHSIDLRTTRPKPEGAATNRLISCLTMFNYLKLPPKNNKFKLKN